MASTGKRTTSSSSRSSGGKSTSAKGSGARKAQGKGKAAGKKPSAPAHKPFRRELGAVVCLLLAFFGAIGYFKTDEGAFIALFCNLLKGLCGYGFYIAPPMLLASAVILAFHRGKPVRLRVTSALLLPVLAGAVFHLFLCKQEYVWSFAMFGQLWTDGLAAASGGVLGGILAEAFQFAFSEVGAIVVLLVLALVAALCACQITFADIIDFFREKKDSRVEYDPEDYEQPERSIRREPAKPAPSAPQTRRTAIDIPVDDGPLIQKKPTTPVTTVRKKKLFDRLSGVTTPDQVVTGNTAPAMEAEKPEYEDVPELTPAMDSLPEKKTAQRQPDPTPAVEEVPLPPPIIREPAVQKVSRDEARQAGDQVAREIEENMAEEPIAYRYPPLSLLSEGTGQAGGEALSELHANQQRLEDTLQSFGVDAHIVNVTRGPSVTGMSWRWSRGSSSIRLPTCLTTLPWPWGPPRCASPLFRIKFPQWASRCPTGR